MKDRAAHPLSGAELRRYAEARLCGELPEMIDAQRQLHELQVHKIELEMQNEQLLAARDALEASMAKYGDFYDFVPVSCLTLTAEGAIHEANLTATTYLGVARARLLGRRFAFFLTVASRAVFATFLRQLHSDDCKRACEVDLSGDPPRHARLEGMAMPACPGEEWHCLVVLIDLTELKASGEQLRAMTETYRRTAEEKEGILDALPAQIALLDPLGRIVAVNESWRAFADANALESTDYFIGRNYLAVCDGAAGDCFEEAPVVAQGLRAVLAGKQYNFALEYPCHSPHERRWFRLMATPVSTERIAGAVVMHVDITRRWLAEAKLQRTSDEMRALARHLEVIHDNQAARIARELHDELGQTLTILKLHFGTMQKRLEAHAGEAPSVEARAAIGLIEASFTSLRRLCTELRPPMLDHLGLGPALAKLAADFQSRFSIPCTLEAPANFPLLDGQLQARVYRLVQELLTNVARHAAASAVRIVLRQMEGTLELEVADNGRGITDTEQAGMKGLGLLGMRERALAAGGTITIKGQPGQGTTARACLPLTPPAEP